MASNDPIQETLRQASDAFLEQIRAIEAQTADRRRDPTGNESALGSTSSGNGAGNAYGRGASRSPRRQAQPTSLPVEVRPLWRGHAQALGVNDVLRQTEPIMCQQQNSLQHLPQQSLQQLPQQPLQPPQDPGPWQAMQPAPLMQAAMMSAAFPVQAMMQQQFMMQQFMMAPMACMQQMMLNSQQADLEEASRQMGKQAYDNAVNASRRRAAQVDDSEDEAAPLGPSSDVSHPNYRPAEMEAIPGVTDRRFEGKLKLWFEEKGYGFIESEELRKIYPDVDVFLHQNQKRHFEKGDSITFSIFMNFRGRPQGTELRRFKARPRNAG